MATFEWISAEQALQHLQQGALLVSAYDNEQSWEATRLPSAISWMELEPQLASLPRDRELITYCA